MIGSGCHDMKFSDLSDRHADAIASLYLKIAEIKAAESQELARAGLRLLVLGNGAGILLLATFMGVIVQKGEPLSDLVTPLVWFLVGTILSALIYVPLIVVARDAANHLGTSIENFFKDKIELEELQSYGLTKRGAKIVNGLLMLSLFCFVVGVILCVIALYGRA